MIPIQCLSSDYPTYSSDGDGCTSSNFFYDWALLSHDISATPAPHFVGASVYPQSTDPSAVATLKSEEPTYLGKKFVFPAAKLNELKLRVSQNSMIPHLELPQGTREVYFTVYTRSSKQHTRLQVSLLS